MKFIQELMQEIYDNSKIPFELVVDNKSIYLSPDYHENEEIIEKTIEFNATKCYIRVYVAFSNALDLLAFLVKSKLEEVFKNKNQLIKSLLDGYEVDEEVVKNVYNMLNKEFTLINIYVENNINEVILDLKECYYNNEVEILKLKGYILIIGEFEELVEHVASIKELVATNNKGKTYISYTIVPNYKEFKKLYKESLYKIELAIKYNLVEDVFDDKKLVFEGIIDSVNREMKEKVSQSFNKGFSLLDNDMIKTIEMFFKCGLNLSETAKALYIHRNTLIYRLDKIQKYTTYDIREFNSAVLFKIVFFLWKEKNN